MPRVARGLADGIIYHVINRGNGRQDPNPDQTRSLAKRYTRLFSRLPTATTTTINRLSLT